MIKFFISLSSFLVFMASVAQVKLPRLISDSMILQRDTHVKIWGWAAIDEKVTVTFHNKPYSSCNR
jgi:sialate O-acetylesterase